MGKMKVSGHVIGVALLIALLVFPLANVRGQADDSPLKPASELSPKVAAAWMQLVYDRVMVLKINPPAAARLYGYAGLTLYQAVLPGMPANNSYAYQLNGLEDFPMVEMDKEYDWILTANAAMRFFMVNVFPDPDSKKAAESLFQSFRDQRAKDGVTSAVIKRSAAFGEATAKHILAWASKDQYTETREMVYTPPEGDSAWAETTPGRKAIEPFWGQIRPFALYFGSECAIPLNMPFSTKKDSAFYLQALEVKTTGDKLSKAQKDTALYWLDNLGDTGTPAGHWMMIGTGLVDQFKLSLARTVEMYSLLGITVADSFIGCWSTKYVYNLLRPETYIKRYINPQWNPFIQTPAFPEYPSGHSVVSAAAAETLTFMFGTVTFTDASKTRFGMAPRKYLSFYQAADEAAWSRLYGGIHFRLGIESGLRHGMCIGHTITSRVNMKPVPQGE
ncbi:MAG: vanadium-dependent haloperoxidase [Anaerolineae bacterium]|nr:vanadium-dependent haloperoxidase [Anaerolineae bacterium]